MTDFLQTERLILRNATTDDAQILTKWKSSFLLREMSVGLKTRITEANQRADIEASRAGGNLYIIMQLKADKTPIGYIRLGWMDKQHTKCWLSYGMGEHYREGYCYEALHKLLNAVFKYDMLKTVVAEVFEFNTASSNLLCKLGFKLCGERRNEYFYKGRHWSIYVYQLTENDLLPPTAKGVNSLSK